MTPLTKPVTRSSTVRDAGREVIVRIGPGDVIAFRLKGCRKWVEAALINCYHMACKAEAAARRKAKRRAP